MTRQVTQFDVGASFETHMPVDENGDYVARGVPHGYKTRYYCVSLRSGEVIELDFNTGKPLGPLTVNDFDNPWSYPEVVCGICHAEGDHDGRPHAEATGDGLSRYDILEYLDGRKFRNG